MQIQYLGFSVVASGREYNFLVLGEQDRSFAVAIAAADFLPGRLKYQEGPDISYRKLIGILGLEPTDTLPCLRQQITESEITDFRATGKSMAREWTVAQRLAARERLRTRMQH